MNLRTCLATNKTLPVTELQRFTIQDGVLLFDRMYKNSGRGGYLIRDVKVLDRLNKLKGKINYKLKYQGHLQIPEAETNWFRLQFQ